MLMAYNGEFWISKFYVSRKPPNAERDLLNANDTASWRMTIVDINKNAPQ
jgi:hypothetical protein